MTKKAAFKCVYCGRLFSTGVDDEHHFFCCGNQMNEIPCDRETMDDVGYPPEYFTNLES